MSNEENPQMNPNEILKNRKHHIETRELNGVSTEISIIELTPPEKSGDGYPPVNTRTTVEKGITIDWDVPVKLRDGVTIYTDIYRPEGATDIPAIIVWSPYGKQITYSSNRIPVPGVPDGTLTKGTKTEGPDPDYWCRQGYAVVNPDARGTGYSEGTVEFWSKQEGKDIYDLVEFLAVQTWSNGKIGMADNSWLAASQWLGAAQCPPHLAAIAPWEGTTDPYNELMMRGGIPDNGMGPLLDLFRVGKYGGDSVTGNMALHPFRDNYWKDKIADFDKIKIPAYVAAGWNHFHLWGTIKGFNKINSKNKWLRIHREFEWPDQYNIENREDLKNFFDRYLKDIHNGWELTPKIRMDVMDRGEQDFITRRPEKEFPIPETNYRKFYLNAEDNSLNDEPVSATSQVSYDSKDGKTIFDYTFDKDTELTGYYKLRLWVESKDSDDMDLFINLQKADADGNFIPVFVVGQPYPGASGMLRVSHRGLDETESTESQPVHLHLHEQKLKPNEIVPVDIAIWPSSRIWHKGERLRIEIAGKYIRESGWFEPLAWNVQNEGEHVIHTGGQYESYLLVPKIPDPRPVIKGNPMGQIL